MDNRDSASGLTRINRWLEHNPWSALLIVAVTSGTLYAWATHFPWREPYEVGPTWLDLRIPYLAWTVPVYLTYFMVLPAFAYFDQHTPAFVPIWYRAFAYVLCNLGLVIAFPTRVSPWGVSLQDGVWAWLLQSYDTPLAAAPSGHVGLPCCLWLASYRFGGKHSWLFGLWTLVLGLSILTTKQHYCWDLVAGIVLAITVAVVLPARGETRGISSAR